MRFRNIRRHRKTPEDLAADVSERDARLQEVVEETKAALHDALSARDPEIGEHCSRSASLTEGFGRHLKLDSERVRHLRDGALLHDVGVIGVPDAVLLQPLQLEDTHPIEYQAHVEMGFRMLRGIPFTQAVILPVIRHHHENWDGTGYPDGLKGEAIPYEARIVAVVNVFDRLVNGPYVKRRYTEEDALVLLKEKAGRMFDPEVVAAFIGLREG